MSFCPILNKDPYARPYQMLLRSHRNQCNGAYHYRKLGIFYERCQLTETLLSGEVRNQVDTCVIEYCLVENYTKNLLKTIFS